MASKGNIPWNKGLKNWRPNYKHSQETKVKIGNANSKSLLGKKLTELHKSNVSKSLKGRIFSEEHKIKLSKARIGKYYGVGFNKGHKHSIETIRKLKISHLNQVPWNKGKKYIQISGNKHFNWKGGITSLRNKIRHLFEYRQWICDVFTRDDYICQKCNIRGGNLEAHHIKRFTLILQENQIKDVKDALNCKELWNINNGQTLCKKCHQKLAYL